MTPGEWAEVLDRAFQFACEGRPFDGREFVLQVIGELKRLQKFKNEVAP